MANKFYVALMAAFGIAGSVTIDGNISLHDWVLITEAFVGALGVYQVSNAPKV